MHRHARSSGIGNFSFSVKSSVAAKTFVTALGSSADSNTSEFSAAVAVS